MRILLATISFIWCSIAVAEPIKVAVLHPLLGDLVKQVGKEHVQSIDLIGAAGNPHHFEPDPADLEVATGSKLYFVAGMGLEGYLPELRTIIENSAKLIEVGSTLPAIYYKGSHQADEGGEPDPHWWHSINLFRRATGIVAQALAETDPTNAKIYQRHAADYQAKLDELARWVRLEISKIPRDRRQLATAHSAFNYFCRDFGFTPHSLQGLNGEQMPNPVELAALVKRLRENQVGAIFPERESNPKILGNLTKDTGIKLGAPLIADGMAGIGYEEMIRLNVNAIVAALSQGP